MAGIEAFRALHEELEQIELAGSEFQMRHDPRRERVLVEHALVFFKDSMQQRAQTLLNFQLDKDGLRTDEVAIYSPDEETDIWHKFYGRVRESKEYEKRHMDKLYGSRSHDASFWYEQGLKYAKEKEDEFSGGEVRGRFVDLVPIHLQFTNLKKISDYQQKEFIQSQWLKHLRRYPDDSLYFESFRELKAAAWNPIDYVSWLRTFHLLETVPRAFKYRQGDYKKYLTDLTGYLENFITRQQPLLDWKTKITEFRDSFDALWSEGLCPGWETKTCESPLYAIVTDKLLMTETAMNGHITSKEYKKAYERYETLSEEERAERLRLSVQQDYDNAFLEQFVRFLRNIVAVTISDTIEHVTRKQARTAHELEMELAGLAGENVADRDFPDNISEQSSSGGEEIGAGDRAIYNPKNLPMGPDGKPIPYWQYKLFGLDKEFRCEICGNYSYYGRRTFEKHFSEWRHINGLRALRIQNSNHFFGITGIEEAISINDKLRKQTSSVVFNADKEMECEDAMGNVMTYRAYQDLVRQGMI